MITYLRLFYICLDNWINFLLGRRRFLFLLPVYWRRQFLFDRTHRRIISLALREAGDLSTLVQVFSREDYSIDNLKRAKDIYSFYSDILKSGSVPLIIDCGANIGFSSVYFSSTFPHARIVCVEPDEDNLSIARQNIGDMKADYIRGAIGSVTGYGKIENPSAANNSYSIQRSNCGPTEIFSVNRILELFDSDSYTPFMIKIDIEGFESDLFSCATEWVEKFGIMAIELHDWLHPLLGLSRNFLTVASRSDGDFLVKGEIIFCIKHKLMNDGYNSGTQQH